MIAIKKIKIYKKTQQENVFIITLRLATWWFSPLPFEHYKVCPLYGCKNQFNMWQHNDTVQLYVLKGEFLFTRVLFEMVSEAADTCGEIKAWLYMILLKLWLEFEVYLDYLFWRD